MRADVTSPEFSARRMTARAEARLIRQLTVKRAQKAVTHPGCCTCDACRVHRRRSR